MEETTKEAYERGEEAGRIDETLRRYGRHFEEINGSVAATAKALADLSMQVQRLADQAIADAHTRVSTAHAVEKARKDAADMLEGARVARKERSDLAWTPITRIAAGLGMIVTILAIIGWVKALT